MSLNGAPGHPTELVPQTMGDGREASPRQEGGGTMLLNHCPPVRAGSGRRTVWRPNKGAGTLQAKGAGGEGEGLSGEVAQGALSLAIQQGLLFVVVASFQGEGIKSLGCRRG